MTFSRKYRVLSYIAVCVGLLVLIVNITTFDRQGSGEDEIFAVSTGWSIAHAQAPKLSVLALFPATISPIRFYGPVSFEVSALLIRLFGLSAIAWRLACFSGVIFCILVSSALVRRARGDHWAQLITVVVLSFVGSISSAEPGRFDFVTTSIFLSGLLAILPAFRIDGPGLLWRVLLAGTCVGFALGSTPRTLTLIAAAMVGILVVALAFKVLRKRILTSTFGLFLVALVVHNALLSPWKLNTFSWYAFVRRAASQDKINASPLAGPGIWQLDLQLNKVFLTLLILLTLLGIFAFVAQRGSRSSEKYLPIRLFLSVFATVNLILMLLLLARPLGQSPFWLPPLLIAAMSWFEWERLVGHTLEIIIQYWSVSCLHVITPCAIYSTSGRHPACGATYEPSRIHRICGRIVAKASNCLWSCWCLFL